MLGLRDLRLSVQEFWVWGLGLKGLDGFRVKALGFS